LWVCLGMAAVALVWSLYIDFCFFRQVLGYSRQRAAWSLLAHRAVAWIIFLLIFGGGSLWSELA
jgi:hypothetical protein